MIKKDINIISLLENLDKEWPGSRKKEELLLKVKEGEYLLTATQENMVFLLESILKLRERLCDSQEEI